MARVDVSPHDPAWPQAFACIHGCVWPVVQHAAMALEHVGSTAGALVASLARQFPDDLGVYLAGTTPCVLHILRRVGLTAEERAAIGALNAPDSLTRAAAP